MPPPPSGVRWGKLVISTFQSRQFGNRRFDIRYFGSRNNPFYLTNPSIRNFRKLCSKLSKTLFETFENFVRNFRKLCSKLTKTLFGTYENLWKSVSKTNEKCSKLMKTYKCFETYGRHGDDGILDARVQIPAKAKRSQMIPHAAIHLNAYLQKLTTTHQIWLILRLNTLCQ
jgi:hypothetical protein